MTASKQHKPLTSVIIEPVPQRPKTLLQRLSSGIIQVLPPFRASTSRNALIVRPLSEPNKHSKRTSKGRTFAESEQLLVSHPEPDIVVHSAQTCPYKHSTYHSFASIEQRRCNFCGMRSPKIVPNKPCDACRVGGPESHIYTSPRQVDTCRRHSDVDPRHLAHIANSSSSVYLGPRLVAPERAAKRVGNPPRVSRLPPGIIRLPVPDYHVTQHHSASRQKTTSLSDSRHIVSVHSTDSSGKAETIKKPSSPKLHHIHGLPNSESFPFVHNHEIPKHAIALRAGSTSPLTDRSSTPKSSSSTDVPPVYSSTTHHGAKSLPSPAGRALAHRPQVTTVVVKEVHESGRAVIDLQVSPLNTNGAGSQVYRKRSPQHNPPAKLSQASADVTDSGTTFGSQDTGSTRLGDIRLELRGGNSSREEFPRLRGGSGREGLSTNTFSFKLKRWLLTCDGPCPDYFDTDSDADLPPPRVVSPMQAARMQQKMNGRVPLPLHLSRDAQTTPAAWTERPDTEGLPPATTFMTTISGPQKRSLSSVLSTLSLPTLFRRPSESPVNQPTTVAPSQVLHPPFPHLRGGAESSDRIPPTLFWLAGGTGRKPISFSSWRQSRPKQRMGGLFGMAVFGNRYGQEYKVEASVEGESGILCSASVKVVVEDGTGVKDPLDGVEVSSKGSSLGASAVAECEREVTAGAETINGGPARRAITQPPADLVDEVPLCSGALPVEPTM